VIRTASTTDVISSRSFAAREDQVEVVGSLPALDVMGFEIGVQDVGDEPPCSLLNDPSAWHPGSPDPKIHG